MNFSKLLSVSLAIAFLNSAYAGPIANDPHYGRTTTSNSNGANESCDAALDFPKASVQTAVSTSALDRTPFPPASEAFAYGRGLIDATIPVTAENQVKGKTVGVSYWGLRIYPVKDLNQAMDHFNSGSGTTFREMSMQSFYLVLPEGTTWENMPAKDRAAYSKLEKQKQLDIGTPKYQDLLSKGARLVFLKKDQISVARIKNHLPNVQNKLTDAKAKSAIDKLQRNYIKMSSAEKDASLANLKTLLRDTKAQNLLAQLESSHKTLKPEEVNAQLALLAEELKDADAEDLLGKLVTVYENFLATAKDQKYPYKSVPIDILNTLPGDANEDTWTDVPAATADKINKVSIDLLNEKDGEFFYLNGWFMPEVRGVLSIQTYKQTSIYKEMEKFRKNLLNKGYSYTTNANPDLAIIEASRMVRKEKRTKEISRFDKETVATHKQMIALKTGYTLEIWHPLGILTGGTFGPIAGKVVGGDSVYYPRKDDPDVMALYDLFQKDPRFAQYKNDPMFTKSIDFGKLAIHLLILNLEANGATFVDAGMVSPFTKRLGGEYVWQDEYLNLLEGLAKSGSSEMVFSQTQGNAPQKQYSMEQFVLEHTPQENTEKP